MPISFISPEAYPQGWIDSKLIIVTELSEHELHKIYYASFPIFKWNKYFYYIIIYR